MHNPQIICIPLHTDQTVFLTLQMDTWGYQNMNPNNFFRDPNVLPIIC